MSDLKNKTIITVATTGAWPTKANNPNVPMTPEEISEDVYACWKAGAAIAHLHMRDDEGKGTMDKEKFRKTVELLRSNHPDCDIVLNMTTSGALTANDWERMVHVSELRPEMASYDCGSMNWLHTSVFLNSPSFLEELGKNMQEWGVKPEIEAFDPGMIANAAYYLKKGVLKAPLHFQFCMGHGVPVPRLHLELLRRGPLRAGDAVRCRGSGRPHPRGYGGQCHVLQGRSGREQRPVCGARRPRHPGVRQAARYPRRGPRDPQHRQVSPFPVKSPVSDAYRTFLLAVFLVQSWIRNTQRRGGPILEALEALLDILTPLTGLGRPVLAAIDGRCGSGKSTLSQLAARQLGCPLFHMDDFFLPPELRTPERYAQPGGNVHYERVEAELLRPLRETGTVSFRPFDCHSLGYKAPVEAVVHGLAIVEGSYSLHPALRKYYDCTVFLTCAPEEQRRRLLEREGPDRLPNFLEKWIPLEEHYFRGVGLPAAGDLVLDTTPQGA